MASNNKKSCLELGKLKRLDLCSLKKGSATDCPIFG